MRPSLIASLALLLVSTGSHAADSRKVPPDIAIAVIDFEYHDTSGEERDQRQEHDARLKGFMAALKRDLAAQGKSSSQCLAIPPRAPSRARRQVICCAQHVRLAPASCLSEAFIR